MICRILATTFLWCVLFPGSHAQQGLSAQLDQLTSSGGWIIDRETAVSPYHPASELIYDPSGCNRREVLVFDQNGTYKRTFEGKNCTGIPLQATSGKWKHFEDPKVLQGNLLIIRLDDEVNNLFDMDLMLVTSAKNYDMLMFVPDPDKYPSYRKKVLVYKRYGSTSTATANTQSSNSQNASGTSTSSSTNSKSSSSASSISEAESGLKDYFKWIREEDVPMSKTFEEAFKMEVLDPDLGILFYKDKMTGAGPSVIATYITSGRETLVADIRNDDTGSFMVVYELRNGSLYDVTEDVIDSELESMLLSDGFDQWNTLYFDGMVANDDVIDASLIYSLPAFNFIEQNPYVFIELKVTWDEGSGTIEDTRVLGQLNFTGENFEFSWLED